MTLTKGFTDELKMLNAESIMGASANELLHNTIARIAKQTDAPVRLYASATPDALLNIAANLIEMGDGAGKSTPPVDGLIGSFVATTVNMQTGAVSGGTVNMLAGGSFALPASTLNYYRRLCLTLLSDGTLQANFSAESSSTGGLTNAGTLFAAMSGMPCGYIDLQCDDILGKYRTAGSSSAIIENKVGSYYPIIRFGAGAGTAFGAVGSIQTLDGNKTAAAGTSPKAARVDHVHPITTGTPSSQTADQTNAPGSSASLARADHIHNIATAVPTDIGSSNTQGSATTFATSDHVHKGIHSLKVGTGGTSRFGDIVLKNSGLTITDNGDNSFTFASAVAAPVLMYATATPDAKLNISPNLIQEADGAGKSTPPIEGLISSLVLTSIDFQTGAVTGGTVNMLGGGSFALPASTLNYYRRVCFSLQSDGSLQAQFSTESSTLGGLTNPGTLFALMTGLPVGYLNLECDNIAGSYRTAGSLTAVIENNPGGGSTAAIIRFGSGGGGASLDDTDGDIATLNPAFVGEAGVSTKATKADHVHPLSLPTVASVLEASPESTFTYYSRSDFSLDKKTFFGSTTGTDAILGSGKITLGVSQNFISSDITGSAVISDAPIVNAIQVKTMYNTGKLDPIPTITGSVDGGNTWVSSTSQVTSGLFNVTDINFTYSALPLFDAGAANGTLTSAYYIAEIFQPTYRMAFTAFGAYVKLSSASTAGSVVGKLYAVSGGVPTTLIATSKEVMAVGTDITTTSAYKVFSFNSIALSSTTQYALVLYSSGMSVTLSVDQVTSAPAYILGSATAPDGSTWSGSGSTDLAFQIYGTGLDVRVKVVSGTAASELIGFGVDMVNNTPTVYSGESAYETRVITSTEASTGTITLTSIRFTPGAHQLHCNYNGHDFMAPDFLEIGGQVVQFPVSFFTLGDVVKFYVTYGVNNSANTPLTINNIVSSNSTLGSIQIPTGFTLDKPWMEIPLGATVSGAGNIETTGLITGAGTLSCTGTILSTGYAPTQPKVDYVQEYTSTKGVSVQGRTDGGSVPAGYIGEVIDSSATGLNITSGFTHYTTVSLTAGRWVLSGMAYIQTSGAASTYCYMSITTSSGSSGIPGKNHAYGAVSSAGVGQGVIPGFYVDISSPTTYYLNANTQTTSSGNYCAVYLMAQRIG